MNYTNHNLRTNLQEWKNRLIKADYYQFGNQLKYLFDNMEKSKQIKGLIDEACLQYPLSEEEFLKRKNSRREIRSEYGNEMHQAAFCYQFFKSSIRDIKSYNLHHYWGGGSFDDNSEKIVNEIITPIIYFIHDKLDNSSSVIYLLEKYKKRTEWFNSKTLFEKYDEAKSNYEKVFEDDLRLFLFDQGIDFPFSTPLSASGRADIIGEIETDDPIIIEIKVLDKNKNYGKQRIIDGFAQINKYSDNYNKEVGYLVVFNLDQTELNLNFSENKKVFPASINFNNKVFYFILINLSIHESASKIGGIKSIDISEEELIKSI